MSRNAISANPEHYIFKIVRGSMPPDPPRTGFVRLRENLENLEKGTFLKKRQGKPGKLREFSDHFYNLRENSGNTQGILFCQISLIK